MNNPTKEFTVEQLRVTLTHDRESLGEVAATYVEKNIIKQLQSKDELRIIFAAAPSQNEMLKYLTTKKTIDWSRIIAFHMDEYIGLSKNAQQLFSAYLNEHLFSLVKFKKVNIINSQASDMENECIRYASLLQEKEIDLVCMGIGENGHIAFNDPPVADFHDSQIVKIVQLDDACRQQQVNDTCFASLENVPQYAITLTIPTLLSANALSVVVPGTRKAEAVNKTLLGPISTTCPASILRTHQYARLFIDTSAFSLYEKHGIPE